MVLAINELNITTGALEVIFGRQRGSMELMTPGSMGWAHQYVWKTYGKLWKMMIYSEFSHSKW